jgi:hypothetical protein
LIVAGNFDQVVTREIKTDVKKDSFDFEIIRQKLLELLKKLGVAEKYHHVWLSFFDCQSNLEMSPSSKLKMSFSQNYSA